MRRGIRFGLALMWGLVAHAQAQDMGHAPKDFFNISPQIGWTNASGGGLFGGAVVSEYLLVEEPLYLGVGVGAYQQGNETVGEVLLKGSFLGIVGASLGPTVSETGRVNLASDLWANAMLVGVRWRAVHRQTQSIHSVAVFVPLGLLLQD